MDKLKDKLKSRGDRARQRRRRQGHADRRRHRDLTGKVKAGELVNHVAQQVGGKGGGRPDMAQAGGTDPAALPAALQSVRELGRAAAVTMAIERRRRGSDAPQFASDNNAGICPEALAALVARQRRSRAGYGDDDWTRRRDAMPCAASSTPTATSSSCSTARRPTRSALAAICRSTDAIVCHAMAHINVDECGAPEFFSGGAKLLTVDTPHAKLTPRCGRRARGHAARRAFVAAARARAHAGDRARHGLHAGRAARAVRRRARARHEGAPRRRALRQCGRVARLRAGGHRVARRRRRAVASAARRTACRSARRSCSSIATLADEFARRRKQGGQLASKMRFLAAPWIGVLDGRRLAAARRARQRDGAPARRRARARAGRALLAPVAGERRVRRPAARRDRRLARARLALLRVRRRDRLPLHVRVGHAGGGGRPLRRRPARELAARAA